MTVATWTAEEVAVLKTAIASGVLTVTYDGPPRRSVTYQSLSEMRSLLASMQQDIAAAGGSPSYKLIATRTGL
jgi:hypothetical protein